MTATHIYAGGARDAADWSWSWEVCLGMYRLRRTISYLAPPSSLTQQEIPGTSRRLSQLRRRIGALSPATDLRNPGHY
jgi:cytochrome c-type biogenesis protein CcmE